jgi:hypothetical protein
MAKNVDNVTDRTIENTGFNQELKLKKESIGERPKNTNTRVFVGKPNAREYCQCFPRNALRRGIRLFFGSSEWNAARGHKTTSDDKRKEGDFLIRPILLPIEVRGVGGGLGVI